jgi:HAD superfamily hydrolase (TIGR01484 family)
MLRLLSTDFDGTLVNHDARPAVAPELLDLLLELRQQGAVWAVNTGRTVSHIAEGLTEFGFPFAPDFILTSERHVFRPGRDEHQWEAFGDWNARCDLAHDELFAGAREVFDEVIRFVAADNGVQVVYESGQPAGLVAPTEAEMERIAAFIDKAGTRHPHFNYQRNTRYLRFCHREYSKGAALGELGRLLNISREEIFAAGDHYNDIPMLDGRFARWAACPSNAAKSVKETVSAADGYVAQGAFSNGVAEALRLCLSLC